MSGPAISSDLLNALIARFRQGDRRALARLITLLDNGTPPERIFDRLSSSDASASGESGGPSGGGRALKIGLTGSMGVGKSTLAGALIRHLRQMERTAALVACDPQSRLTGGALLGDRLRVDAEDDHDALPATFIRSLSTRGAEGGISASAGQIARLLEAFGFSIVLLETIGVGQDQAAVRQAVDVLVLITAPGAGDAVQWQKAGLIEYADVVAVNQADRPGADAVLADVQDELAIGTTSGFGAITAETSREAVKVSARTGEGIAELWHAVQRAGGRQGDQQRGG